MSRRQLLERYPHVREDYLRYLEKWGLIRRVREGGRESGYAFGDVAVVRLADAALASGASFRGVVRSLLASRVGQLAFDFRTDAPTAKVIELRRRPGLRSVPVRGTGSDEPSAERFFAEASASDDGNPDRFDAAITAYRRALELDPYLVPALINLGNLHYARDEIAEAQALYERAIVLDSDVFEAHFNLGNVFHDLGHYDRAHECYRRALHLNPGYAEAHFYLAVTLEKSGQSANARPHWRAYQQLAPHGEWVELAKEFGD